MVGVTAGLAFALPGGLAMIGWPKSIVRRRHALGGVLLFVGLFSAFVAFSMTVFPHVTMSNNLKSGRTNSVEGLITGFSPMPSYCHGSESFEVSAVRFEYSDNMRTGGFNQTSTCGGGPFRAGQLVRLNYVAGPSGDNVIVRAAVLE